MAGERGRPVHDTQHVGVQMAGEGGRVGVGQRTDGVEHPGVVDPQVDPAEPAHDLIAKRIDRSGVAHVHRGNNRVRS